MPCDDLPIPSNYKTTWDLNVVAIFDSLSYMKPIIEELCGEKVTLKQDGWIIEIRRDKEASPCKTNHLKS